MVGSFGCYVVRCCVGLMPQTIGALHRQIAASQYCRMHGVMGSRMEDEGAVCRGRFQYTQVSMLPGCVANSTERRQ
jgi:hypothetical protein